MEYKLQHIGIKYTRFDAVDGTTHPVKADYNEYLKNRQQYKYDDNEILYKNPVNGIGAYGLLNTYKKLIDTLDKRDDKNILILEDDIAFHNNFYNQ